MTREKLLEAMNLNSRIEDLEIDIKQLKGLNNDSAAELDLMVDPGDGNRDYLFTLRPNHVNRLIESMEEELSELKAEFEKL